MLLQTEDIYARIYEEIVSEITREETDLVTRAISAAEQEAKMYLSRYNLELLFGTPTEAPEEVDVFLKVLCTDIAVWHLVKLGHPSVKYEHARTCYEDAINSLKNIQSGKAAPDWAYKETAGTTYPDGDTVFTSYNKKRRNHF